MVPEDNIEQFVSEVLRGLPLQVSYLLTSPERVGLTDVQYGLHNRVSLHNVLTTRRCSYLLLLILDFNMSYQKPQLLYVEHM